MNESEKRRCLLNFLDEQVFHPILNSLTPSGHEGEFFKEVQKTVDKTWIRYQGRYATAAAIKEAFHSDLRSPVGQELAAKLLWLKLPRFEDIEEDFLKLCQRLDV